jgi:hypothetical protein
MYLKVKKMFSGIVIHHQCCWVFFNFLVLNYEGILNQYFDQIINRIRASVLKIKN